MSKYYEPALSTHAGHKEMSLKAGSSVQLFVTPDDHTLPVYVTLRLDGEEVYRATAHAHAPIQLFLSTWENESVTVETAAASGPCQVTVLVTKG